MTNFLVQLQEIFTNPLHSLFLIISICLLEIVLSFDNAAVLATMVKDLPEQMRNKALKYGIIGAYVFRGLALLFATSLISIWWLKPIGGAYLLWMTYSFFKGKSTETTDDDVLDKEHNWFYTLTKKYIGVFWSTVAMVEIMDIVFSIDNIFAVVAYSNNIVLICLGVFVGILAMRFVATKMVVFMHSYPFLETCAFVVIGILGLKLMLSILTHYNSNFDWIESETFDWIMSIITLLVFIVPVLYHNIKIKHLNTIIIIIFGSVLFTSCNDGKVYADSISELNNSSIHFKKCPYNLYTFKIKNMDYIINANNSSPVNITLDSVMCDYYKQTNGK